MTSCKASCLSSIFVFAGVSLAIVPASTADVIHVPGDQPTIQAGIDAAQPGDMVLVAPGAYSGPGNHDLDFGGRDISVVSEAGPESTIIDPQGAGRGFHFHSGEGTGALVEGFTIRNSGGILIDLSSPTIRNCVLTGNTAPGMHVMGIDLQGGPFPQPTVEACTFEANAADGLRFRYANGVVRDCRFSSNVGRGITIEGGFWGGGSQIFERCTVAANTAGGINVVMQGAPTFIDCEIRDHAAGSGPGVLDNSEHGRSSFRRCTFARNGAGAYVQTGLDVRGAYFEDCTFEANSRAVYYTNFAGPAVGVRGCRFLNNSTTGPGGAIAIHFGDLIVEGSVFSNNTAGDIGGAVATLDAADVTLRSSTIVGCGAQQGAGLGAAGTTRFVLDRTIIAFSASGEAVACGQFSSVMATCCDLYGNAGGDWVGCAAGMNGIDGNISADPQFCDRSGGDFTLADTSPCAPPHSGACGLIGALPVGCGATAVRPATWGGIKAAFR